MRTFPILAIAFLVTLLPSVTALSAIRTAEIHYTIEEKSVTVEQQFTFPEPFSAHFEIPLPRNVDTVTVSADGVAIPAAITSHLLTFDAHNASTLIIHYRSPDLLDGESFLTAVAVPLPVEQLRISLKLPARAVLRSENPDSPASGAAFPSPRAILSDGESVILNWEQENFQADDEIALYVRYRESRESKLWLLIVGGILLVAILGYFVFRRVKAPVPSQPPLAPTAQAQAHYTPDVTKHLKEDEQQIVTILKNREGSCEQGTLRVITSFSKAKLSGLLFELEARKIIHKEKRGKKNLIFLKEI